MKERKRGNPGGDLPDYHQYVTSVKVEIPPGEEPEVWIAEYDSTPEDLPDGSTGPLLMDVKGRVYVVQHEKDRTIETLTGKFVRIKGHATDEVPVTLTLQEIIPRPKGGVLAKGSVTSAAAYATVASRVVTSGLTFQLSKIVVSAEKAAWIKYRWAGSDISCERLLDDKTILIEHFPWDYYPMTGDGSKAFDVQAKYNTVAGKVNVEIVGEEVVP